MAIVEYSFSREKNYKALQTVSYGEGGSGKSSLSLIMYKDKNPLVFDFDNSYTGDLAGKADVISQDIKSFVQLEDMLRSIWIKMNNGEDKHQAIIFDCADQIQELMAEEARVANTWKDMGVLTFGGCWIPVQQRFNFFLNNIIKNFNNIGICIHFNCHATTVNYDSPELVEKVAKYAPALNGKIADMLINWSDATLFIYDSISTFNIKGGFGGTETKAEETMDKMIVTSNSPYVKAKNRHNLDKQIKFEKDDPMLDLVDKLNINKVNYIKPRKSVVTGKVEQKEITTPETTTPEVEKDHKVSDLIDNVPPKKSELPPPSSLEIAVTALREKMRLAKMTEDEFKVLVSSSKNNDYTFETNIEEYGEEYLNKVLDKAWNSMVQAFNKQKLIIQQQVVALKGDQ